MPKLKTILKTKKLTKQYAPGKGALDIDLEIRAGEIVGFLGPNGAGKTTTMRLIMHMTKRDKGELYIFGRKIDSEADMLDVLPQIGFLPGEGGLYENLTPKSLFSYAQRLYQKDFGSRIASLAKRLDLDQEKPIKQLSLGNKRKVGVILSVLHNPSLLILDEPTSGLDPLIQREVIAAIREVKDQGGAVFLSSHVLSEVQSVCDRVVMIKDARVIFSGKTKELLEKAVNEVKVLNVSKKLEQELAKLPHTRDTKRIGDDLFIYTTSNLEVARILVKNQIEDFYIEQPTLEKRFSDMY